MTHEIKIMAAKKYGILLLPKVCMNDELNAFRSDISSNNNICNRISYKIADQIRNC